MKVSLVVYVYVSEVALTQKFLLLVARRVSPISCNVTMLCLHVGVVGNTKSTSYTVVRITAVIMFPNKCVGKL